MFEEARDPPTGVHTVWRCRVCNDLRGDTYSSVAGLDGVCSDCQQALGRMVDREEFRITSDGGSTAYYRLPEHATELRHLISHKGMSKSRGDVFKACYRLGEKEGADILYDLKKMQFFVEDLIEMYERGESV